MGRQTRKWSSNSAFTLATCCQTCCHTSRSTCCSPCISMEPFTLATCRHISCLRTSVPCARGRRCTQSCRRTCRQCERTRQQVERLVSVSFHTGDMCGNLCGNMCGNMWPVRKHYKGRRCLLQRILTLKRSKGQCHTVMKCSAGCRACRHDCLGCSFLVS